MAAEDPARNRTSLDVDRLTFALTIAVLVCLPLASAWSVWSERGGENDPFQNVIVELSDLVLFFLLVACVADSVERRGYPKLSWRHPAALAGVTLVWIVVTLLATPSWRGMEFVFRIAAVWAVVRTIHRSSFQRQSAFLMGIVVLGVFQAILGSAQAARGEPVGIDSLEWDGNWYQAAGGFTPPRGSFTQPYVLAGLLIVSVAAALVLLHRTDERTLRQALQLSLTVLTLGIGLTVSRAVLIPVAVMICVLPCRRRDRAAALAIAAGLTAGLMFSSAGYAGKLQQSRRADQIDGGRIELATDAINLIERHPAVGVGPGRYVSGLREIQDERLLPVHNVVLHVSAETGIAGGVLVTLTMASFFAWLWRRGRLTMLCGMSLLPFTVLDVFPYDSADGVAVSALWVAVVVSAASTGRGDLGARRLRDRTATDQPPQPAAEPVPLPGHEPPTT